jgi:hypothetical protein
MNLQEINYPVFQLRNERPQVENDVTFYLSGKWDKDGNETLHYRIIDDKSLPGDTLGKRRIRLKVAEEEVYPLRRAIFFLGDLIKLAKANVWFIDNLGKIFTYKKTARAKLSFHKVIKIFRIPSGGVIVEVEGISTRFKAMYPPDVDNRYAGILHMNMSLILYGFYNEKFKDTWRGV